MQADYETKIKSYSSVEKVQEAQQLQPVGHQGCSQGKDLGPVLFNTFTDDLNVRIYFTIPIPWILKT